MTTECDIAIVGAGLTGSVLAASCCHSGKRIVLIDAAAKPRAAAGRVSALAWPVSEQIPCWPQLQESDCCPYEGISVYTPNNRQLHFDADISGQPFLGYIVNDQALLQLLAEYLQQQSNILWQRPAQAIALQLDGLCNTVVLDNGEHIRASLVVAADGADSALRRIAGIPTQQSWYAEQALVCSLSCTKPHQQRARQLMLPGGPLALLPLTKTRCAMVWTRPADQAKTLLAASDADFKEYFAAQAGFHFGTLENLGKRRAFPLRKLLAQQYIAPRLALLGDAAHVLHPLAGLGANMGLRDVALLASLISQKTATDIGHPLLLRHYQRRRRLDNRMVMASINVLRRLFLTDGPLTKLAGLGLAATEYCPPLKQHLVKHATWPIC